VVAALVAVPVIALVMATAREIDLYRRFDRYRQRKEAANGGERSARGG
jgi:hypothetical protein